MKKLRFLSSLMALVALSHSTFAANKYWDINGATAGAGGATPSGTWNTTTANWSTSSAGTAAATTFAAGDAAFFSAGTDATGIATITTGAAMTAGSVTIEEGTVNHSGTSANTLSTQTVSVNSGAKFSVLTALSFVVPSAGGTCTLNGGTIENRNTSSGGSFLTSGSANGNMSIVLGTGGGKVAAGGGAGIVTIYTGLIQGTGPLTIDGTGTFRLTTTTATYSGATIINGKLQISTTANVLPSGTDLTINSGGTFDQQANQTVGSLSGAGTVAYTTSGTTLTAGNANDTTFSGAMTGVGIFTKVGAGTLTIQTTEWANTGGVNINAGSIKFGNSAAGFASTCPVSIASGATLDMNNINDTFGSLAGAGNVVNGGNISVGGSTTTAAFSGSYTGSGTFTKTGTGIQTLSGANGFTAVNFNGGRINFNNSSAAGSGTITVGSGATEFVVSTGSGTSTIANSIVLSSGANPLFYATSGSTLTQTGVISGSGALTRDDTGSGTINLNGNNTFSGGFKIVSRTVRIGNQNGFGTGNLTLGDTTTAPLTAITVQPTASLTGGSAVPNNVIVNRDFTISGSVGFEIAGTVTLAASPIATISNSSSSGVTLSGVVSGAFGLTKAGTGKLTLNGVNTYSGGTTINAGTLIVNSGSSLGNASGALTINAGTLQVAGTFTSGRSVTLGNAAATISVDPTQTYTLTSVADGTGGLTKSGTGTLDLQGANTYAGTTTVSAGTLKVSGSIGSGAATVASGATLTGSGSMGGTLAVSGILAPGNSIGTITTGSETLNGGGQLNWELADATGSAGSGFDSVAVNGTLDVAATSGSKFIINISGSSVANFNNANDYTWDVITTTGGVSNFDSSKFSVVSTGFTDSTGTGGFGVKLSNDGNSIQVFFARKPSIAVNNPVKSVSYGDANVSFGGEGVDFTTTSSTAIVSYQWRKDGANVVNDANISGATTPTLTLASVYGTNAGSYQIVVGNAVGTTTSSDMVLSVAKLNQTVTFNPVPAQTYGVGVDLSTFASASSGLPVSFSVVSGSGSIVGTTLTATDVGTVRVAAAQVGNVDYNAATPVEQDITVGTKTLTVTPNNASRAYGDSNPVFSFNYSGFAFSETLATSDVTGAGSLTASSIADGTTTVGTAPITVDNLGVLSSTHYNIAAGTGTLTITNRALQIIATATSKAYANPANTDPTFTWTTNGFVNGDENLDLGGGQTILTGTPTLSRAAGENAGTYLITVAVNDMVVNTNTYTLQLVNGTNTITQAPVSPNITANNKAYNGTTAAIIATRTLSGTVYGSDAVSLTGGTATFASATVGTGIAVNATGLSLTGADSANYTLSSTSASTTADITPATLTPKIMADSKSYNGTTAATIASRSLEGTVYGSDVVSLTGGSASFATAAAGTAITVNATGLSLAGTDAGNYQLSSTSASTTADITAASLSPNITANNKTYDGTVAATIASRSLSGTVYGSDVVSLTGGTATFATAAAGTGKTVNATGLSLTGADAGNYALSSTSASTTADVTAATLTAQITANNKVYDGTTAATIASRDLSGTVYGSDVVSLTGGTATFATASAGIGKTVNATGLSLTGADAANYQLASASASTTANITTASLSPQITANNKVYNGTTSATIATRTLSGTVYGSDDVSLTGGTASFASAAVGDGIDVTATGLSLSGADAGNYELSTTSASTTANITAATLSPEVAVDNKSYDGSTSATIASRTLNGTVYGSDSVTLVGGTASFETATAGNGKNVNVAGLSLDGADSGNYQLSSTDASTTANITPASLTPSVTAANKVYDGTSSATITGRSLSGTIYNSDVVSLTGGTAAFESAGAGNGKTVNASGLSLTGADSGNYQLASTSASTTADISKATPVITWGPLSSLFIGSALAPRLDATADVAGSFAYFEGATPVTGSTVLTAGSHTLTAQFTPTDSSNYNSSSDDESLLMDGTPDGDFPLISVKVLKANYVVLDTAPTLVLTGTVTDVTAPTNVAVKYSVNGGPFATVSHMAFLKLSKPTNWWETIAVGTATGFTPGTNRLVIKAVDVSGNETVGFDTNIFWHVSMPVTFVTNGLGDVLNKNKLISNGNATNFFVGRNYTLSTKVGAGTNYVLTNITYTAQNPSESGELLVNTALAKAPTINFDMKSNMVITFNFIQNPAFDHAGTYNGLFHESSGYKHDSDGFASLTLSSKFKLSGKVYSQGVSYGFTCNLNLNGVGSGTIDRSANSLSALDLNLAVDFDNEAISGTISNSVASGWVSDLTAYRVPFNKTVNLATDYTNAYTLVIPGFSDAANGPVGYSYGAGTVKPEGTVGFKGMTSDGSALGSLVAGISASGKYPFYSAGYAGQGEVIGWLDFTGTAGHKTLGGELSWIKTAGSTNYLSGFTNLASTVVASCWTNAAIGSRAMNFTGGNALMTFSDSDITTTNVVVSLGTDNKMKVDATLAKNFVSALSTKDGVWSGTFQIGSNAANKTKFAGVMLQDQNYGRGFFVRAIAGGKAVINP